MNIQTPIDPDTKKLSESGFGEWGAPDFISNNIFEPHPEDTYEIHNLNKTGTVTIETEKGLYPCKFYIAEENDEFWVHLGNNACMTVGESLEISIKRLMGKLRYYIEEDFEQRCDKAGQESRSNLIRVIESSHTKKYDSSIPGQEPDLTFGNIEFISRAVNNFEIFVILKGRRVNIGRTSWSGGSKNTVHLIFTSTLEGLPNLQKRGKIGTQIQIAEALISEMEIYLNKISPEDFPISEENSIGKANDRIEGNIEGVDFIFTQNEKQLGKVQITYQEGIYDIDLRIIEGKSKTDIYVVGKDSDNTVNNKIKSRFQGSNRDKRKALNGCIRNIVHILKSTNPRSEIFREALAGYKA